MIGNLFPFEVTRFSAAECPDREQALRTTRGRSAKSAAEPAEKPAIIFGATRGRKLAPYSFDQVSACPRAIFDTNVVLDCFVFDNPSCLPLLRALEAGLLHAVATAQMRAELEHVLGRGLGERWPVDAGVVLARWDRHVHLLPEPPPSRLNCSDADDQKFIDLALAHRVPWLLTRDRALLRLARKARSHGIEVVLPERWK